MMVVCLPSFRTCRKAPICQPCTLPPACAAVRLFYWARLAYQETAAPPAPASSAAGEVHRQEGEEEAQGGAALEAEREAEREAEQQRGSRFVNAGIAMQLFDLEQHETIWDELTDTHCVIGWSSSRLVLAFRCRGQGLLGGGGHRRDSVGCCTTPHRNSPWPCHSVLPANTITAACHCFLCRGTASLQNVMTDMKAWRVAVQPSRRRRGRLVTAHAGFLKACAWLLQLQLKHCRCIHAAAA